jgi:hypothetical protein
VKLSPFGSAATTGLLYQSQIIDDGDCGAIGGMKIGRGSRSTRRKPAPVPNSPPQIPHDLTRTRTRAAVVGSRRLTAWTTARPSSNSSFTIEKIDQHDFHIWLRLTRFLCSWRFRRFPMRTAFSFHDRNHTPNIRLQWSDHTTYVRIH